MTDIRERIVRACRGAIVCGSHPTWDKLMVVAGVTEDDMWAEFPDDGPHSVAGIIEAAGYKRVTSYLPIVDITIPGGLVKGIHAPYIPLRLVK